MNGGPFDVRHRGGVVGAAMMMEVSQVPTRVSLGRSLGGRCPFSGVISRGLLPGLLQSGLFFSLLCAPLWVGAGSKAVLEAQ